MAEATLAESPRPAFRWWGERVRIVIAPARWAPSRPDAAAPGATTQEAAA
jgi:hypothetical protein